jgi:hypothetical protein
MRFFIRHWARYRWYLCQFFSLQLFIYSRLASRQRSHLHLSLVYLLSVPCGNICVLKSGPLQAGCPRKITLCRVRGTQAFHGPHPSARNPDPVAAPIPAPHNGHPHFHPDGEGYGCGEHQDPGNEIGIHHRRASITTAVPIIAKNTTTPIVTSRGTLFTSSQTALAMNRVVFFMVSPAFKIFFFYTLPLRTLFARGPSTREALTWSW